MCWYIQLTKLKSSKMEESIFVEGVNPPQVKTLRQVKDKVERAHLVAVMNFYNCDKSLVARLLGVDRKTLYTKLKYHNIQPVKEPGHAS